MNTPVIVLDFNNNRVFQVLPGHDANKRELQNALERSRLVTTGGVGASPPPRQDDDQH